MLIPKPLQVPPRLHNLLLAHSSNLPVQVAPSLILKPPQNNSSFKHKHAAQCPPAAAETAHTALSPQTGERSSHSTF